MNDKQLYLSGFNKNNQKEDKRLMLVLSSDKIILSSVIIILLFTLTFSIGVEKGKRIDSTKDISSNENLDENDVNQFSKSTLEPNNELNTENKIESLDKPSISQEIIKNSPIHPELSNELKNITSTKENTDNISYAIQVASFLKENSAHKEADGLKEQGYPVSLVKKGKYIVKIWLY